MAPRTRRPVQLAPAPVIRDAKWQTPIEIDPFSVAVEDKVALLLAANESALKGGARFVNSAMFFLREDRAYANSDGSYIEQTI